MARKTLAQLIADIEATVYQNTSGEITGASLQTLLKELTTDLYLADVGKYVASGAYSGGTLTLTYDDGSTIDIPGWKDLAFLDSGVDISDVDKLDFTGTGVSLKKTGTTLDINIDQNGISVGNHFVGIYDELTDLNDAIGTPADHMQAIVLKPSEKYYHGVGGSWVELAPVSAFHSGYIGAYDTLNDLDVAQPSPTKNDLAIIGVADKEFYVYTGTKWDAVTHTDLPALAARMSTAETHLDELKRRTETNASDISAMSGDITQLQNDIFPGIKIEDEDGNTFNDIKSIAVSGATVSDSGGTDEVNLNISPKITVANGQEPGSVSLEGNAIVFPDSTVSADPNDANVLIVGRTDTPKFDPSMFQSAVDHGYAADDQGIKSSKTTDGWWIFKDLKSVGSRPSDSFGDLFVFRNDLDVANPALKHSFIMAIGKDKSLNNKVWFMYRDGTTWTPWFSEQGASQTTIDNLSNSVDELKKANQAVINEVSQLQTAIGKVYSPGDKGAFDSAVNALIQAALKDYVPKAGGHGGDKPQVEYPRFYAQFSQGIPTSFTGATTSTNGEATLVSAPAQRSRIFVSVENDNDEASKVKGFKFNNKLEMTLYHRDIVVDGKKYRSFYTAGAFKEAGVEIKVDFGQGI